MWDFFSVSVKNWANFYFQFHTNWFKWHVHQIRLKQSQLPVRNRNRTAYLRIHRKSAYVGVSKSTCMMHRREVIGSSNSLLAGSTGSRAVSMKPSYRRSKLDRLIDRPVNHVWFNVDREQQSKPIVGRGKFVNVQTEGRDGSRWRVNVVCSSSVAESMVVRRNPQNNWRQSTLGAKPRRWQNFTVLFGCLG